MAITHSTENSPTTALMGPTQTNGHALPSKAHKRQASLPSTHHGYHEPETNAEKRKLIARDFRSKSQSHFIQVTSLVSIESAYQCFP